MTISELKLPKWAIAGLALPLAILNLWLLFQLAMYLEPITSIVVTASLIAFLLEYPIEFLARRNISRKWAATSVLLLVLLFAAILFAFLGPLVWEQLNEFVVRVPQWIEGAKNQDFSQLANLPLLRNLPFDLTGLLSQFASQLSSTLESTTYILINATLSTIASTVNLLTTIILSLLLVFNGDRLWSGLLAWLPLRWQNPIQDSLKSSFQGYVSGQATLAIILATALSLAFTLLDIPFGLLFGILIGLASAIPFGGTIAITVVSVLLAFQNVWLGLKVLLVSLLLGQINENLVAPRLLSGATGLNPAVVILSLLIGIKLDGFLGLVLAVPVASFLKKIADSLREAPSLRSQSGDLA